MNDLRASLIRQYRTILAIVALFAPASAISTPLGDRAVQGSLEILSPLRAGQTGIAQLTLVPRAGWHLYGPQHGDAGAPPTVTWRLPRGVDAGSVAFPAATHVITHGISTYEYHDAVRLRIPLAVAADAIVGRLALRADVTWYACSHVCVPGHASYRVATMIGLMPSTRIAELLVGLPFIGLAFLGGLVLNLMPCVFPVFSFKAMRMLEESVNRRRCDAFAYAAGVVASCTALGMVVVATRRAAAAAGWGFQLQSPAFVAILAIVVTVLAVAMTGTVTIVLPIPQGFARRAASASAFGDGVLVTLIASSCVAPYMGAALGFALTASAPLAVAVFIALGMGLALPQLVVLAVPALLRPLPKPGRWILTVRRVLALPLFATAAWLAWTFSIAST